MGIHFTHTSISPIQRLKEYVLFALLIIPMFILATIALALGDYPRPDDGDGM